jgi:hypothetical protein
MNKVKQESMHTVRLCDYLNINFKNGRERERFELETAIDGLLLFFWIKIILILT